MSLFKDVVSDMTSDAVFDQNISSPMVTDLVPAEPSGYSVAWVTDPITADNEDAGEFTLTGGEEGMGYQYIISSSGGGTPVEDSGTLSGSSPYSFDNLDLSGLEDGDVTVTLVLLDGEVVGPDATATAVKDVAAPEGYSAEWITESVDGDNDDDVSFQIVGGEIGAAYEYVVSTSGGGTTVTDTGTIAADPEVIEGVDVTTLEDGNLTVTVTLTDANGNEGDPEASTTIVKDTGG